MSRKPTTTPENNHAAGARSTWRLPTLRPAGPVPSDREADWVPIKDAVRMLSPVLPQARDAGAWLLRHIASGEVPVTCRLLTYRKHSAGKASCERHEWPGLEARLAEQIERALAHPLSGFTVLPGTVDLEWLDVTGDYAVDVHMSFPHVDRAALLSYFPGIQALTLADQEPAAPGNPMLAHLVMPEFERRMEADKVASTIAGEARALSSWYATIYPLERGHKPLRPKAIEPYIRERMNERKARVDENGDVKSA